MCTYVCQVFAAKGAFASWVCTIVLAVAGEGGAAVVVCHEYVTPSLTLQYTSKASPTLMQGTHLDSLFGGLMVFRICAFRETFWWATPCFHYLRARRRRF